MQPLYRPQKALSFSLFVILFALQGLKIMKLSMSLRTYRSHSSFTKRFLCVKLLHFPFWLEDSHLLQVAASKASRCTSSVAYNVPQVQMNSIRCH